MFFLDTNIFVESKKHFYAPDICPAFWQWLCEEGANCQSIRSISKVLKELEAGSDDLLKWVQKMLPKEFFINTYRDDEIIEEWRKMQDSLESSGRWDGSRLRNFISQADVWLIAIAKVKEGCVVTNEYVNPIQKRIKIPLVAEEFGVPCCTISDVMRSMGIRLSAYDREGEKGDLVFSCGRFAVPTITSFSDIFPLDS